MNIQEGIDFHYHNLPLSFNAPSLEAFFNKVAELVELSAASKAALANIVNYHEVPKGRTILKQNSVCNHFYFVKSGLLRTFYDKDGKDVTDWLSPENTFSCSILSLASRMPDRRGIEALEDSQLWSIQYYEINKLFDQYHEIERLGRMFYKLGIMLVQQRFDDLHFASALERYRKLMNANPTLILRTPLSMIASYLGITQETLSRIRSQYGLHKQE